MADTIQWVAGLLEGEGCFYNQSRGHNPIIQLGMTDLDIVVRVAKILGCHKVIKCKIDTRGKNPKSMYRTVLYGSLAIEWMMTLYTLMGTRRKEKIKECLLTWKKSKNKNYPQRTPYSRGAEIVWQRG